MTSKVRLPSPSQPPSAPSRVGRAASQPSEGDCNDHYFKTKLDDHARLLEKFADDAYYQDAVERLASGTETVQTVIKWLASLDTKNGTCALFLRTFNRLMGYKESPGDAPLLATYMTTPASELHARAMERPRDYAILSLGLWVAWNLWNWDKPEDKDVVEEVEPQFVDAPDEIKVVGVGQVTYSYYEPM